MLTSVVELNRSFTLPNIKPGSEKLGWFCASTWHDDLFVFVIDCVQLFKPNRSLWDDQY
jgi:hypothetical protein